MISNAIRDFIAERLSLNDSENSQDFIIKVPLQDKECYRVLYDWSIGEIVCVFDNINMANKGLRKDILAHVGTLNEQKQRNLANTSYIKFVDSVMISCCVLGDINLVMWCMKPNVDINHRRLNGESPLYVACVNVHLEIVQLLLKKTKEMLTNVTPLSVTHYTLPVKMVTQNKPKF